MLLEDSLEMDEKVDENNKCQEEEGRPGVAGQQRIRLHVC